MMEVQVTNPATGQVYAKVTIKNEGTNADGSADYSARIMTERGSAIGLHRRMLYAFPRKRLNALALVLQVLNTLDEKELELEHGFDPDGQREAPVSTDLVGRQPGARESFLGWLDRVDHHRPSLRREQPLEPGGDGGREEVGEEDSR